MLIRNVCVTIVNEETVKTASQIKRCQLIAHGRFSVGMQTVHATKPPATNNPSDLQASSIEFQRLRMICSYGTGYIPGYMPRIRNSSAVYVILPYHMVHLVHSVRTSTKEED